VIFLLYLNIVLSWSEDGRLRPKHVAKYNLNVIIASCIDVCCVLTVHNIRIYKFDIHNGMASLSLSLSLSLKKIPACALQTIYDRCCQTVGRLCPFF